METMKTKVIEGHLYDGMEMAGTEMEKKVEVKIAQMKMELIKRSGNDKRGWRWWKDVNMRQR